MQLKKLAALLLVLAVCQSRFAVLAQEESDAAAGQEQSDAGAAQESAAQQTTQQTTQEQQAPQLPQLPTNQKSDTASENADPLSLGDAPDFAKDLDQPSNTLPPFTTLNSASVVAPNLAESSQSGLSLDIDRRIQQTEDLLNRMVWQLNRETSWANSVHDIIQNYQYKYTKVLSNIKKHTTAANKMRDLASTLKKARLHEILESDLSKATRELTELAASSTETTEDEGSYASLKDRVSLMKQDLEKMSHAKVNKVLHGVQDQLKAAADDAIPPPSADTLKGLVF